jgi:hypothetical protein
LWRALVVAGTLVVLYAVVSVATFRRFGSRAAVATSLAVLGGSVLWAVVSAGPACDRLGRASSLASWLPPLVLLSIPAAIGALAARASLRAQHSKRRSIALVALATALGLCLSAALAVYIVIAFYGPDCWP